MNIFFGKNQISLSFFSEKQIFLSYGIFIILFKQEKTSLQHILFINILYDSLIQTYILLTYSCYMTIENLLYFSDFVPTGKNVFQFLSAIYEKIQLHTCSSFFSLLIVPLALSASCIAKRFNNFRVSLTSIFNGIVCQFVYLMFQMF